MKKSLIFSSGPFLSASNTIQDSACNFYFSYLFQETVAEQLKVEFELEKAIDAGDADRIKQLEIDLSLIEGAYHLSSFVEGENSH